MTGLPLNGVFTPFLRRFTDERARERREIEELYRTLEARQRAFEHDRSSLAAAIYDRYRDRLSDVAAPAFRRLIAAMLAPERALFDFPADVRLDQLSLREQVDLTRFLYAKQHALDHAEKVMGLLVEGILRIYDGLSRSLPALAGPSPFTIPLIHTLEHPKSWIEGIYAVFGEDRYRDNGLFTELFTQLHLNLCEVSGIADPYNPKKPFKLPTDNPAPVADILEAYLRRTPFLDLFLTPVPLKLTEETRFSHAMVLGGSGAGKTQLLQHLILSDLMAEEPPALIIVDSQTDLLRKISHLALFDPDDGVLADRLIMVSPRDIEHPPALNIFDMNRERLGGYDALVREQVTAGVIQTFDYLFNGLLGADLTAKQGVFFRFVARLMLALPDTLGRNATILDLIALMDDAAPYKAAIESLPPIQRAFFERDFQSKTFAQTREQIRYRLNAILENPTFARLFTAPRTKLDLFSALNDGSIILVDTAKDFLKGSSAHFGRIFISLVLQAILERAAIPEEERKPAFLIVDEAADYFDSNIDDLLTEARKYKLGCVFASQFLDQAPASLRASFAANTAIKLASGVSMSDARALAPDLRTTPDFILAQPALTFAAYIRGSTPQAVSVPVPAGRMEREPRMSDAAFERLLERNREKVSLPPEPPTPTPSEPPQGPGVAVSPSPDDPGTGTAPVW